MSKLTQKAIVVSEVGKPVKQENSWPVPQPESTQLQLQVTVAGLNPFDQKARDIGLYVKDNLPAVLALDVVGRVSAIGSAVSGFAIGDRILSQARFTPSSAYHGLQQYAISDADLSMKIPDCTSDDEAATLPSNVIASLVALFDSEALAIPPPWDLNASNFSYKATVLLIVGGGSNCGRFGVQLAALAGIGKILVVGGNETELRKYGATHYIDRHDSEEAVLKRIRDIVGDELIYSYDTINPHGEQHLAINALSSSKKGTMARLRPTGEPDVSKIHQKAAGYEVKSVWGLAAAKPHIARPFLQRLPAYLQEGKIWPTPWVAIQGLNPERINETLDLYRDKKRVVKTGVRIEGI